jgi:hypothetical protein
MSLRVQSSGYDFWRRAADESDTAPAACDCASTIRELLIEVAGTAIVFFLIISIVRALH